MIRWLSRAKPVSKPTGKQSNFVIGSFLLSGGFDTPSPALAPGASVATSAQGYSTTVEILK